LIYFLKICDVENLKKSDEDHVLCDIIVSLERQVKEMI